MVEPTVAEFCKDCKQCYLYLEEPEFAHKLDAMISMSDSFTCADCEKLWEKEGTPFVVYNRGWQREKYRKVHPRAKAVERVPVTFVGIQEPIVKGHKRLTLVNLPNGSTVVYNEKRHRL